MKDMTFYISPAGNDNAPGTREEPMATLRAARDAVRCRRRKEDNAGSAEIVLLPGTYPLCGTVELDREDNNTVIRGEKQGTARLYGGKVLTGFQPVTDEAVLKRLPPENTLTVYQCDLKANGITDYGIIQELDGCFKPETVPFPECYCNGQRMELARWPKDTFLHPASLVQAGKVGGETSILEYDSPRHERWTKAEDLWLFGYFHWLWADSTIKVGRIDTEKKHLIMKQAYLTPYGAMDDSQGIVYYAFNLLEELSAPGEYYLDRNAGMLYFIPPCPIEDAVIEIGMLSDHMIRSEKTENITVKDLDFDLGRGDGIGFFNCNDTIISGCRISRFAGNGINVTDGFRCRITDCEVCDVGRTGIDISGGIRETLTPGGHEIVNNILHDTGKLVHTYTPPLAISGCGSRVANNTMYNCPSSAIRIEGNDLLVEYNDIHSVVLESDDQGAIDSFGNPTFRNMVFRYNYIHDVGKRFSITTVCGAAGIRLDDVISGAEIYGNIFESCSMNTFGAVQINSGRENRIHDNLFLDCKYAASGGWNPNNHFYGEMHAGFNKKGYFFNELYLSRYPELKDVLDMNGTNFVDGNVVCGCAAVYRETGWGTQTGENLLIRELGVSLPELIERCRKEFGFEVIDPAQTGAQQRPGSRRAEAGKPISKPLDWKDEDKIPEIRGDAVILPDWHVFGSFSSTCRDLTGEELSSVPESLDLEGRRVLPVRVTPCNGKSDLNKALGDSGEQRVVWVFAELETSGGVNTVGCGFDWWGTVWIDGKEVYSTGEIGNEKAPVAISNHFFEVELSPGRHTVAVRYTTGLMSGIMALAGAADMDGVLREELWWLFA